MTRSGRALRCLLGARAFLLAGAVAALVSCSDATTPTGNAGCVDVEGAYTGTWGDPRCSPPGAARSVAIVQDACSFTGVLTDYGLLYGEVEGDRLLVSVTLLASSGACGNTHLSGTGNVTFESGHTVLRATFGTAATPPAGCACLPGPGGAAFELRQ